MEQDKYKRIQLAYQKIVDSEASFTELAIKTILEEVKQKGWQNCTERAIQV